MCAWTDTGDHIYNYNLDTGEYLGKVRLSPSPKWIQGIAFHDGMYYLTADDGDADEDAPDHVYCFELLDGASDEKLKLARTLDDVQLSSRFLRIRTWSRPRIVMRTGLTYLRLTCASKRSERFG